MHHPIEDFASGMAVATNFTSHLFHNATQAMLRDAPDEHSMYIWGISIRVWSILVAAPCVFFAVLISFVHMVRHCGKNQDPEIRRHILRILFMVPVYAVNACMALLFPFSVEFFTLFREAYEAITIYSLAQFLFTYLGGETRLNHLLALQNQEEDEYHLYRLAQNLANPNQIVLSNKNFVHEPDMGKTTARMMSPNDSIPTSPVQFSHTNTPFSAQTNDCSTVTTTYANSYLNRYNNYYKPWYHRIPFFNQSTVSGGPGSLPHSQNVQQFAQNDITVKKTPNTLSNGVDDTPLLEGGADISDNNKTSTFLTIQDSTTSTNQSSAATVVTFTARRNIDPVEATAEDIENYRAFKSRIGRGNNNPAQSQTLAKNKSNPKSSLFKHTEVPGSSSSVIYNSLGNLDDDNSVSVLEVDELHQNHLVDKYTKNNELIMNSDDVSVLDGTLNNVSSHNTTGFGHNNNNNSNNSSHPTNERILTLEYKPALHSEERRYPHLWPVNYLFPPVTPQRFLFISKFGILQYVPIQITCAVLALLFSFRDLYHPGSWSPSNAYPYISIILNCSQASAMYALFFFLTHFSENLKHANAIHKALTIKAVVFATFWQSCIIAGYYYWFPWCTDDYREHEQHGTRICDVGEWNSETQAVALNNFLICVEMLLFAILHVVVFSWREFGRKLTIYDPQKPLLRSVIEFFSPEDIMVDVRQNMHLSNFKQVLIPKEPVALVASEHDTVAVDNELTTSINELIIDVGSPEAV